MLSKSRTDVATTLSILNSLEFHHALIVPTETGMSKAIMDATAPVRDFLAKSGLHDFGKQAQGPEHKVKLRASVLYADREEKTTISLYRPETKDGDPRIWIYGLPNYAEPWDLLAICEVQGELFVINCSDPDLMGSAEIDGSPLQDRAASISDLFLTPVAEELLSHLRRINHMGWVPTLRKGDTGVGMTLETLLGIDANASKKPDFKGIELKSKRSTKRALRNRSTLFSQVPDWNQSPIKTAQALLEQYGYTREGEDNLRLYNTVKSSVSNSQGHRLRLNSAGGKLDLIHGPSDLGVLVWDLEKLHSRLLEKHAETFWVEAEAKMIDGLEHFRYYSVTHTRRPLPANFDALIETGTISVDLTLKELPSRIRDHGYLFKLPPAQLSALFPRQVSHTLDHSTYRTS